MTPTAVTPAGRGTTRSKPRPDRVRARPTAPRPDRRPARPLLARATARARLPARAATARPSRVAHGSARTAGHRAPLTRPTAPRSPRRVSGPARADPRAAAARRPDPARPPARPPTSARCPIMRCLTGSSAAGRGSRCWACCSSGSWRCRWRCSSSTPPPAERSSRATTLQTHNEQLRAAVANASDDQRIESTAAHMGMVMPQPAARPLPGAPSGRRREQGGGVDHGAGRHELRRGDWPRPRRRAGATSSDAVSVPTSD